MIQGQLCALDVGEASVLHEDLLMDGLQACPSLLRDSDSPFFLGCCIKVCMTFSWLLYQGMHDRGAASLFSVRISPRPSGRVQVNHILPLHARRT